MGSDDNDDDDYSVCGVTNCSNVCLGVELHDDTGGGVDSRHSSGERVIYIADLLSFP